MIGHFINESLYRDSNLLSEKAQNIINKLGDSAEKIINQLRISSLKNIHEVSTKFNHNIIIRHRISRDEQKLIAFFDRDSAKVLQAEQSAEILKLSVVITRLNIHTGNGRLQLRGEGETVAFGFNGLYKEVDAKVKKLFSENLDFNNGLAQDKWKHLTIEVNAIKLKDERVVKYIIRLVYEN